MKRQIKFRGKDRRTGKWVYGDLLAPITGCRIVNYTSEDNGSMKHADYHYHNVLDDTVGQFTGLRDCTGKEIYEGDIIRFHFMTSDIRSSKLFPTEKFMGRITIDKYNNWVILSNGLEIHIENAVKYGEVVGNIHDNPELLNPDSQ